MCARPSSSSLEDIPSISSVDTRYGQRVRRTPRVVDASEWVDVLGDTQVVQA